MKKQSKPCRSENFGTEPSPNNSKTRRVVREITRVLLLLLASMLIGIGFFRFVSAKVSHKAVPTVFGIGMADVLSGSMEPTLKIGDLLIVKETGSYEAGDIVVFHDKGLSVVHRIQSVDIEEGTVITKGDANTAEDEPIAIEQIAGEVVFRIPILGYAAEFMKTPAAIIMIIGISAFLIEVSFRREKQQKQSEREQLMETIKALREEKEKNAKNLDSGCSPSEIDKK